MSLLNRYLEWRVNLWLSRRKIKWYDCFFWFVDIYMFGMLSFFLSKKIYEKLEETECKTK